MTKASASWKRVGIMVLILGGVISWRAVEGVNSRYDFSLNVTESLSNWAFITDKKDHIIRRGDLVQFDPPRTPYYPADMRFVKRVAGVPGDTVEVRGREFFVAGHSVGMAKETDKQGHFAVIGPVGVIPPGHYFVQGDHVDSLDSRYEMIGWIPADKVVGRAEPIL